MGVLVIRGPPRPSRHECDTGDVRTVQNVLHSHTSVMDSDSDCDATTLADMV